MDAMHSLPMLRVEQNRTLTPAQSEIIALLKKTVAVGEWNKRGVHEARDELRAIEERLARIEDHLTRLDNRRRDVPE